MIVEQSTSRADVSASQIVYEAMLADLDEGLVVPGQRLTEQDLAARFGLGRNAVREALQRLAGRGVVELRAHRSPTIRSLTLAESLDVLDVLEPLLELMLRIAAKRFDPATDATPLADAVAQVREAGAQDSAAIFERARRRFYRALLRIGGNRELERLMPTVGMHIISAQYRADALRQVRITDYAAMADAVAAGDPARASEQTCIHVAKVRAIIVAVDAQRTARLRA